MLDAIVHQVLSDTPGLVFMKEEKGFTSSDVLSVEGGEPFPFSQGVGRCVNTKACQKGPPPLGESENWTPMNRGAEQAAIQARAQTGMAGSLQVKTA